MSSSGIVVSASIIWFYQNHIPNSGGIYVAAFVWYDDSDRSLTRFHYCLLAASITGVLLSFFAIPKIKDIMDMRTLLLKLVRSNKMLKESRAKFKQDIKSVNRAHNKLDDIQSHINESNQKLKDAYDRFSRLGNRLDASRVPNIDTLRSMQDNYAVC